MTSHPSIAGPLLDESRRLGVSTIVREQIRRALTVTVQNGTIEEVGSAHVGGVGFQVYTAEGFTAFGFADGFDLGDALATLRRTAASASTADRLGASPDPAIHSMRSGVATT